MGQFHSNPTPSRPFPSIYRDRRQWFSAGTTRGYCYYAVLFAMNAPLQTPFAPQPWLISLDTSPVTATTIPHAAVLPIFGKVTGAKTRVIARYVFVPKSFCLLSTDVVQGCDQNRPRQQRLRKWPQNNE